MHKGLYSKAQGKSQRCGASITSLRAVVLVLHGDRDRLNIIKILTHLTIGMGTISVILVELQLALKALRRRWWWRRRRRR